MKKSLLVSALLVALVSFADAPIGIVVNFSGLPKGVENKGEYVEVSAATPAEADALIGSAIERYAFPEDVRILAMGSDAHGAAPIDFERKSRYTISAIYAIVSDRDIVFYQTWKNAWRPGNGVWDHSDGTRPEFQQARLRRAISAALRGMREPLATGFSFDDSTDDHYHASKALEKFGWRGDFSIASGQVDRETKNPQKGNVNRPLNWYQCREMLAHGHRIHSHTRNLVSIYKLMAANERERVRDEIVLSKQDIVDNLGVAPEFFMYHQKAAKGYPDEVIRETGMKFMKQVRLSFGGFDRNAPNEPDNSPNGPNSIAKTLARWYDDGVAVRGLMFHGILPGHGVYRTFLRPTDFEQSLPDVKKLEQEGKVTIMLFDEFYDFIKSRGFEEKDLFW